MDTTDALSRSRYRERRLNKVQVLASVRLSKAISTPLSGNSGENKPQIISPENRQWFLDRTSDNSFGGHVPSSAHFLLCLPPKNVKSTLAKSPELPSMVADGDGGVARGDGEDDRESRLKFNSTTISSHSRTANSRAVIVVASAPR